MKRVEDASTSAGDASVDPRGASEPAPVPAEFALAALGAPTCVPLGGDDALGRGLFVARGAWHAFYTEGIDVGAPLELVTVELGTETVSEPVAVVYGARTVDLREDDGMLRVLAGRQYYAVALDSEDGVVWNELQNVAPDEPTYNCNRYPPLGFFRGARSMRLLAMGNEYNTGVFGCVSRVFVSVLGSDGWETPTYVGDGDALLGVDLGASALLVTTRGMLVSEDDGATWSTVPDVSAHTAVWTSAHLLTSRQRSGVETGLVVERRDETGALRGAPIALLDEAIPSVPKAVADGDAVGLVAEGATRLYAFFSPDGGARWSSPASFDRTATSYVTALAVHATGIGWLVQDAGLTLCVSDAAEAR